MLSDRSKGYQKLPSWCIHASMDLMRDEFDKSELEGTQKKAMSYMTRNALMFTKAEYRGFFGKPIYIGMF